MIIRLGWKNLRQGFLTNLNILIRLLLKKEPAKVNKQAKVEYVMCRNILIRIILTVVMIVLTSIFVIIILGAIYELWRSDRKYRRRKELTENAQRIWNQSQHVSFPESGVKVVSFKKVSRQQTIQCLVFCWLNVKKHSSTAAKQK